MSKTNYSANNTSANNLSSSSTNLRVNQNKMCELGKRNVKMAKNAIIPSIMAVGIVELAIHTKLTFILVAGGIVLVYACLRTKKKNDQLGKEKQKIKKYY